MIQTENKIKDRRCKREDLKKVEAIRERLSENETRNDIRVQKKNREEGLTL